MNTVTATGFSVGTKVRLERYGSSYETTIWRETNRMWVCKKPSSNLDLFFYKTNEWNGSGYCRGYGKSNDYTMYTWSADAEAKVARTTKQRLQQEKDKEALRVKKAEEEAARQVYLKTPAGILETRQKKEWFGYELKVDTTSRGYYHRQGTVMVVVNGQRQAEVNIYQDLERNYETRTSTVKPATVNWSALGSNSVEIAKAYMEAIQTATKIAETWNLEVGNIVKLK